MRTGRYVWKLAGLLVFLSTGAAAHQAPNIQHTHAFEQTAYGKFRQGHYVDGPQGSIIIWSPRTYGGYQQRAQVEFARPSPMTQAPSNPLKKSRIESDPAARYGKKP